MPIGPMARMDALERRLGAPDDDDTCWCPSYVRPFDHDQAIRELTAVGTAAELIERQRCPVCTKLPMVLLTGDAHVEGMLTVTMRLGERDLRDERPDD